MTIFFVIVGAAAVGLGFVVWLLKSENQKDDVFSQMEKEGQITPINSATEFEKNPVPPQPISPIAEAQAQSGGPLAALTGIFGKFGLGKKPEPGEKPFVSLKDKLPVLNKGAKKTSPVKDELSDDIDWDEDEPKEKFPKKETPTGTAFLKTSSTPQPAETLLSEKDQKNIEQEIDLSFQYTELKEKYERLDNLFKEKNETLERDQKALESELKNRKEFNKVKDILEKEIKELKDSLRAAQAESEVAKGESERSKKRISQLEEKTTKLEKDILTKEQEIDTLIKKLQTFASPKTANVPLVKQPVNPDPIPTAASEPEPPVQSEKPVEPSAPPIEEKPKTESKPEDQVLFLKLQPDILNKSPETPPEPPPNPTPDKPSQS